MKKFYRTGLGLVVAMFALSLTGISYAADVPTGEGAKKFGRGPLENVDCVVEKIENGVTITITSEDEEVVERLQSNEHAPRGPEDESVTVSKVNIENGVKITMTSTDPEIVEKIQAGPKARGGHGEGEEGQQGGRPDFLQSVTKSVEELNNGIVLTLTSEDAEVVAKLQSHEAPAGREDGNIQVSKVNIQNGVQVTITSDDAETAAKIIENGANPPRRGGPEGRGDREGGRR